MMITTLRRCQSLIIISSGHFKDSAVAISASIMLSAIGFLVSSLSPVQPLFQSWIDAQDSNQKLSSG